MIIPLYCRFPGLPLNDNSTLLSENELNEKRDTKWEFHSIVVSQGSQKHFSRSGGYLIIQTKQEQLLLFRLFVHSLFVRLDSSIQLLLLRLKSRWSDTPWAEARP